jgi:hypothetical protein
MITSHQVRNMLMCCIRTWSTAHTLVPRMSRNDPVRRSTPPEHLPQVAGERERLLVRRKVAAVRVLADEDDVVRRVNPPVRGR